MLQVRDVWSWVWAATIVPGLLWLLIVPGNVSGQIGGGGIPNPAQPAELAEARRLNDEARKLSGEGRYAEAIPLAERVLSLREKVPGVGNPELDAVLANLAFLYKNIGDYARAEPLFQKALALREQALGAEHPGVADVLNDFALLYAVKGDNARAEPLLLRSLAIREKALGAEHMDVGGVLNSLARVYQARGDDDRAAPLFERVLTILEKGVGREHRFVAVTLENLAEVSRHKGDHARAIEFYENSLAIFEKTLGPEHAEIAVKLNTLAEYYRERSNYDRAEPLYRRALALSEKTRGAGHPDVAAVLNNLSALYRERSEYDRAAPLLERALAIQEKALGAEHPAVATTLNNLALLYNATGDQARAESFHQRSLALLEKAGAGDGRKAAVTLTSLGALYRGQGDYARAELFYEKALATYEKTLGPEHPDLLSLLDDLSQLYEAKGDYGRVLSLQGRMLTIAGKAPNVDRRRVLYIYSNLGDLLRKVGEYERAEEAHLLVLEIREKVFGPEHPEVGQTLTSLALIYTDQGDYERGRPLHEKALAINQKAFGPEHREVGASLNNLAQLHAEKGDYARAEPLYRQALPILEKSLGAEHLNVASLLNNLASLYYAQGDYARAVPLIERSNDIRERNLSLVLATGSENQKLLYLFTLEPLTDATLSLHARYAADARAARLALTTILRRKGRALDAMTESLEALRRRADPEDRRLLDELAAVNTQLATLQLGEPNPKTSAAERQALVSQLDAKKEQLEGAVSRRSKEFRAGSQPVTLERVRQALPAGAALVEFVSYQPFDPRKSRTEGRYGAERYLAYVLRAGAGEPLFVELGEAAVIDAEVARLRQSFVNPKSNDAKQTGRALDELVMRPVRRLLGETKQLFLSPDGALNLIPFAALVDEQQRYLVENYSLTYLTSGRDLLRLQVSGESRQPPLVIAHPQFSIAASVAATKEGDASSRRSGDLRDVTFSPLPGTAGEAKALGSILNVTPLTQAAATEAALKQAAAPRILHVATHGFFLPDQKPATVDGGATTRGLGLAPAKDAQQPATATTATTPAATAAATAPRVENPLLRSGIALAGANARQSAGGEDGILTALEATGLNLWGTKLVILSACETGLGKVETGEGVYGLRRALVLAGSESQVMSLWQVSDAATRDLMVAYYQRLQAGEGRTEALRQVQLEMLKGGTAQNAAGAPQRGLLDAAGGKAGTEDRSHPFYWASFIQSGEWRAMESAAPRRN